DQRQIWEKDDHRVICSKKFIPLKEFMKDKKYNRYMLFYSKQTSQMEESNKRWLFHQEYQSELDHYSESYFISSKLTQLEALAKALENIAQDYLKAMEDCKLIENINIATFYELRMKS